MTLNDNERPEMPRANPSYASEKGTPWSAQGPNIDGKPILFFCKTSLDEFPSAPLISPPPAQPAIIKQWVPIPLRPVFWVPLVLLMAGGGIAFEVALHFSQKNHGMSPLSNTPAYVAQASHTQAGE